MPRRANVAPAYADSRAKTGDARRRASRQDNAAVRSDADTLRDGLDHRLRRAAAGAREPAYREAESRGVRQSRGDVLGKAVAGHDVEANAGHEHDASSLGARILRCKGGGSRERGVVAAASYEARVFGVRSAMPSVTARRKCLDLVFVKPRFDIYKAVSSQIRAIFAEHTPIIEPLSLDEAYLDVTENLMGLPLATDIAKSIRARIREETGLTASAGVSYNKFLAKLASDQRKPDGLYVITPDRGAAFVEGLPIGRFHGLGPATEAKMLRLGIATGAALREKSLSFSSGISVRRARTTSA